MSVVEKNLYEGRLSYLHWHMPRMSTTKLTQLNEDQNTVATVNQ